ncbi:Coatomer beta subunit [Parasponia andersonii]|uniref:RING-type E3 ubiquitin transferase n=1 Tax=Parasponia andersonii TaxID=3476 RepID=A0A2P5BJ41_PARAD|nr:Coatomer beta subunit [Parasponia andersonii]
MAASLEDLLAEDGFKGKKSLSRSRTSFGKESPSLPSYHDRLRADYTSRDRLRTERSRSDVTRYGNRGESPRNDSIPSSRPRYNLVRRDKTEGGSKKEASRLGVRDSTTTHEELPKKLRESEIVEVGDEENERIKDIYSNEVYSSESGKDKHCNEAKESELNSHGSSSKKQMLGRRSFSDNNRRNSRQQAGNSGKGSSNGKSFEESQPKKSSSEPALDEVAIQAMVSILSGYIKRFLKDEEFRATLRDNCFSSLDVVELEEGQTESKIIAKLEEAIKTIEKSIEEFSMSTKDLKKSALQLSVIVGLNSDDLKDRFTSGVPNYKLSACAHLYLSVVYKLQKKDRAAAKHLLQVFCDSPFQARTQLLPELWDYLFSPHLSHLKVWYNQEADSLLDSPGKPRKLKLLQKVYNEVMDSGTYQFAVYYKDWLTEGVETTPVPSINIPSVSTRRTQKGNSHVYSSELSSSPSDPTFSPQPMVCKIPYNALFSRSSKPESEDGREIENSDNCIRSSDDSSVVKQTLTYSSETIKGTDRDAEEDFTETTPDNAFFPDNGHLITSKEKWSFLEERVSTGKDLSEKFVTSVTCQETSESTQMLNSPPRTEENELALKRLAKSVFELQQPDNTFDFTTPSHSSPSEASITRSLPNLTKVRSASEELHGVYFEERSSPSFWSIPQDFICPLTGQLFEEPVTLETGQTCEQKAIKAWFDQGNKTCPVTGKALECKLVPFTNLILKRVIDSWKSEHRRQLLSFASHAIENSKTEEESETTIFILEQLLIAFGKEERINNAKHLISLGGLQFLIQQHESGNLEIKTRLVGLLSCCIEADSGCRNQIARDINKKCLLELLHSKQIKARTNAVSLIIELICLKRKKDVIGFLSALQNDHEGIESTMHILLLYLQISPPAQRPLAAVLLLYLDLLVEPRKYSIYREDAVDAITEALDRSLTDEEIRENCCRALLILGGQFSSSGKLLTQIWILNQARYFQANPPENEEEGEEEVEDEVLNNEWLRNLSASLLGNGKRSFLGAISKCIGSENLDLVSVCLTTVAWLSSSLSSMPDSELQIPAFWALISRLKESLENGQQIEHKILASTSLLSFSKISAECRVLLMSMAENITAPLRSLAEETWTAKLLYAIVSGQEL